LRKILGVKKLKFSLPEEINKRYEIRKIQEQKIMAITQEHHKKVKTLKEKIDQRRTKVYLLNLQGYSNQEIVDNLDVSLSTIEKDLHHMRYYCLKWSKQILQMSRSTPTAESFYQIDLVQKELWNMYRKEKTIAQKRRILDSIVNNSVKKGAFMKDKYWFSKSEGEQLEDLEKEIVKEIETQL